ncbi:MAG TPA: alkaline phosphatase family protein [Mycobacteriales bacterium]
MTPSRAVSRRSVLAGAAGTAALAALSPRLARATAATGTPTGIRTSPAAMGHVGDRPYPFRPIGAAAGPGEPGFMPFEHLVIVMMENHSFDTYLGMLPQRGQPKADGFTFDGNGRPLNSSPVPGRNAGRIRSFRMTSACQGGVSQSWNATHQQIDGGRMDGWIGSADGDANDTPMGYYDEPDLPFYYSLAKTFTLANRWFCSTPCQTYPNRRFLVAGTASGDISTDTSSITTDAPAAGTILDRMHAGNVSWVNYFTDLPGTAVILDNFEKYAPSGHYQPVAKFFADCAAGTLPSVSFVDPEFGVTSDVGGSLNDALAPYTGALPGFVGANLSSAGGDEESPENVLYGQAFVASVVNAVMNGRAWDKTLMIWTYDEHGGYYDHVPPPVALAPDDVPPQLSPGDAPGTYAQYGVRVPAVVVSPWSRKNDVTNVVHDHTSILATIEKKWNLPSMTRRDHHAATVEDFVDFSQAVFLDPPALAPAQNPASSLTTCSTADYHEQPV